MILRQIVRSGLWLPLLFTVACGTGSGQPSPTPTMTSFPFVTATERPTGTPLTPTNTPTPTATIFIPTATITPRLTFTPSFTPSASYTPVRNPTATVPGVGGVPCTSEPPGTFGTAYRSDPGIANALGCATSPPDSDELPRTWPITAIYQPLERGYLLWVSAVGWFEGQVIYVLFDDQTYSRKDDFYDPLFDPDSGNFLPPTGLYEPIEELGKIWRDQPGLKDQLGFGTEPQVEVDARMMMFQFGEMVLLPHINRVFIFKRGSPNTWSIYDQP